MVEQVGLGVLTDGAIIGESLARPWFMLADGGWEGIATSPYLLFIAIGVLFYLLILRPERRRQGSQRQMLDAMKKNDRVVTIGGIKGTVISVNREADEVVIRVDDNAKLRLTVGAIARIEGEDAKKSEGA
ncbi:MAG: preprotein translocase subunit YajC [Planctomycetota bacterium]|nr:MAG: preprotein translocase subunit YajC [Planctomycetota bacterium]